MRSLRKWDTLLRRAMPNSRLIRYSHSQVRFYTSGPVDDDFAGMGAIPPPPIAQPTKQPAEPTPAASDIDDFMAGMPPPPPPGVSTSGVGTPKRGPPNATVSSRKRFFDEIAACLPPYWVPLSMALPHVPDTLLETMPTATDAVAHYLATGTDSLEIDERNGVVKVRCSKAFATNRCEEKAAELDKRYALFGYYASVAEEVYNLFPRDGLLHIDTAAERIGLSDAMMLQPAMAEILQWSVKELQGCSGLEVLFALNPHLFKYLHPFVARRDTAISPDKPLYKWVEPCSDALDALVGDFQKDTPEKVFMDAIISHASPEGSLWQLLSAPFSSEEEAWVVDPEPLQYGAMRAQLRLTRLLLCHSAIEARSRNPPQVIVFPATFTCIDGADTMAPGSRVSRFKMKTKKRKKAKAERLQRARESGNPLVDNIPKLREALVEQLPPAGQLLNFHDFLDALPSNIRDAAPKDGLFPVVRKHPDVFYMEDHIIRNPKKSFRVDTFVGRMHDPALKRWYLSELSSPSYTEDELLKIVSLFTSAAGTPTSLLFTQLPYMARVAVRQKHNGGGLVQFLKRYPNVFEVGFVNEAANTFAVLRDSAKERLKNIPIKEHRSGWEVVSAQAPKHEASSPSQGELDIGELPEFIPHGNE